MIAVYREGEREQGGGNLKIRYHDAVSSQPNERDDATVLLARAADGDQAAASCLLPLVYEQLRKAAQIEMSGERRDHTLDATALVHEAYLKLVGPRDVAWANRAHFYAAAAEAMRRILLDHARARGRAKRGGSEGGRGRLGAEGHAAISSVADLVACEDPEEIVRLEMALRRLEEEDPEVAQVVRLRFYAGLTGEQAASTLGKSAATVDRDWAWARAWLYRKLQSK
jgi:RNA polymerase sigma factor (TIGR02999 family)